MKKTFTLVGIFIAIFTIFTSKYFYEQKVKTTALTASEVLIEHSKIEKEVDEQVRQRLLTRNMDEPVASLVNQAIEDNGHVNIVIVSSAVVTNAISSWPEIFQTQLEANYLNDLLSVKMVLFSEKSSYEFVQEQDYNLIIEKEPNILIIEPFLLNDNGITLIKDTLSNLDVIVNEVKNAYPDVVVIVQPPHPLYEEAYYLTQVEELQAHALEKEYFYFDHWENWLKNGYIEGKAPNQEGHEQWADYITNYFIALD